MLFQSQHWLIIDCRSNTGKEYPQSSQGVLALLRTPGMGSGLAVQLLSLVQLFATPRTAIYQVFLSLTISSSLPKFMSIELVMPTNYLFLYHPLLYLLSIFLSIRVFSNESAVCIRWPKYWSFSFNISHVKEYSRLISLKMDLFDLAFQGTLKSLLQHHISNASNLWCSAFFTVQLSHLYLSTGKTIALTI